MVKNPRITEGAAQQAARRYRLTGQVQGVGYRPFVYRLAHAHGLSGWVRNELGRVVVLAQGAASALDDFERELIERAPPLAQPRLSAVEDLPVAAVEGFTILPSEASGEVEVRVPPDYFACDECLAEVDNPADRRYRYPFINCTQCGPRYTIIARLPYDRPNTSMAGFRLCEDCRRDYADPLDRRFHAEPVACPSCGPRVSYRSATRGEDCEGESALEACVRALRTGEIVAVKGVGGYHLLCDASDEAVVARLRERKPRPDKPLAVMFPSEAHGGLDLARREVDLGPLEEACLRDPARAVVLARRRQGGRLAAGVAPGLAEVGLMLPYSPLHHLLLGDLAGPLVATSGNLSGEPVLTDPEEAERRLARVADAFLHHDRPILRPADDSVYRVSAGRARPLRLGRGLAPLELELPSPLARPVLALGAHTKNTISLAWGRRAVVSPHIGDMGSPRALGVLEQLVADLQDLYGVRAEVLLRDAHPGYTTSRWAQRQGLPVATVHHHRAHASALAGESPGTAPWLVFTWDGVGLGGDGTLWGGEALLGRPGGWRRVASLRRFRLPGGERAGREPWRAAAGACWEAGLEWDGVPGDSGVLRHAWERRINAPETSAVGRLFDAAAALTGLVRSASFEGQGPMRLEACVSNRDVPPLPLPLARGRDGLWETDWRPLLGPLMDARSSVAERAASFHLSLAEALVRQAVAVREVAPFEVVGLCGGVFQNRFLTEAAVAGLDREGLTVRLPERLPANDAAIAFGQVVEQAARDA